MVLELTDEATGEVESVTEENMVTEAVNDILGMNPMGVFYSEENAVPRRARSHALAADRGDAPARIDGCRP